MVGRVVEIGARTRTIPPALRRALLHRDHGCREGRRYRTLIVTVVVALTPPPLPVMVTM